MVLHYLKKFKLSICVAIATYFPTILHVQQNWKSCREVEEALE